MYRVDQMIKKENKENMDILCLNCQELVQT